MPKEITIERRIVVFAIWLSLGMFGFCLMVQGIYIDHLLMGLAGVATLALTFAGHLIANAYYVYTFSRGEIAFGTATVTIWVIVFIVSWVSYDLSPADIQIALAMILTVVGCVLGHVVTRHGARGAFSRFHGSGPE